MPAAPWMMPLRKSRSGRPLRIRQTSSQTSCASQYRPSSNRAPPRRSTSSSGRLNGSQSGLKSGRVPRRRVCPTIRSYAPLRAYPCPMDVPRRLAVGGPRGALGYAVAVGGTALVTAPLLAFRGEVSKTTVVLAYLLVVTAAAAAGGLGPGITAAGLCFHVLFLQPYHHIIVADPQDWLSLGVYLLVAVVVSLLVASSERRRAQAERRERETRMLFELSSSLVAHGSLPDTLEGVVRTVRSLFDLAGCAIVLPAGDGIRLAAVDGQVPGDQDERVPMRSGEHVVGALVVVAGGPGSSGFGEAERRVLATFANQAALAVEQGQQEEQRNRALALQETDRLRTALLNSVSHDLRTPLASIKASA